MQQRPIVAGIDGVIVAVLLQVHTNLLVRDVVIIEGLGYVEEAGNEEEEGAEVLDANSWRKGLPGRWKVRRGRGGKGQGARRGEGVWGGIWEMGEEWRNKRRGRG